MSAITTSLVSARLPNCLVAIAIDYFGRSQDCEEMAILGQYEDCTKHTLDHAWKIYPMFWNACRHGHIDIVKLFIPDSNTHGVLDHGLNNACMGNQLDIAKFMITRGASDWNLGLQYACKFGHGQLAKLMVDHGAYDLNAGMALACEANQLHIVELMISCGATLCIGNRYPGCDRGCGKSAIEHLQKNLIYFLQLSQTRSPQCQ